MKIYDRKKGDIQYELEQSKILIARLYDELYILEKKRKSKYKEKRIKEKKNHIRREENDYEYYYPYKFLLLEDEKNQKIKTITDNLSKN